MPLGMRFANWFEYYYTLPTSYAVNAGKIEQMLKSFDAYLSATEARAKMTKKKDLVLLDRTGSNKALGLYHILEVSGVTVVNPEEECDFILVSNRNNAIVVTPDIESLFKTPHQDAHNMSSRSEVMKHASVEYIENIQDSDSQTIRAIFFIAVPPLLIRTISILIVANKGNTGNIFLDVIKAIKEFDYLYKDDSSFTEKADTKCKQLLQWFYVSEKDDDADGIAYIKFTSCTNDTLLKQVKDSEDAHLVQVQDPQDQVAQDLFAPLEQLEDSSRTMQESVLNMTVLQEKGTSSTKKYF